MWTILAVVLPLVSADAAPRCADGEIRIDALGSPADDLVRVAELDGGVAPASRLIRRGGTRTETACAQAAFPWPPFASPERPREPTEDVPALEVRPLPVRLTSVWNSRYPSGANDGLLWSGRGLSQELSGGVALGYGAFSAALAPEVAWSENRAFQIVPNGRSGDLQFGNPYYGGAIDLPQRFGVGPFSTWSPGQSYVRADVWNLAVGLSTENLWLGPGIRNSILMSNAGPGFPHVFVGTSRPADIWIGKAEALLFWGRLDRTRFVENGGHPLTQGLTVTYGPRWVPGLTFGLARVMLQPWDGLRLRDYFAMFQTYEKKYLQSWYFDGNNPLDNQLSSVFGRWVLPEAGLEIYGEWAREDHEWTWWGFVRDPDHSQAFLLGLQKVFRARDRLVRVSAELTNLQQVRPPDSVRGMPVYYVHANDLGYTNEGQLLGAWIGPGADSQTLAVDVFHRGGRIGGYIERVRRNEAYYWEYVDAEGSWRHDAELTGAVRQALQLGRFEVSWEAAVSWRQNRDFMHDEPNFRVMASIARPPGAASPRDAGRSPRAP